MNYSLTGLALTEHFEGFSSTAYQDQGGVWTIGYGRTCKVSEGMTCTQEQAVEWLASDINLASNCVNTYLKYHPLTQAQFDAVVDFTYNVGCEAFSKSTLLNRLLNGDYNGAAKEFLRWDLVKGKVSAGLFNRRVAEEIQFLL